MWDPRTEWKGGGTVVRVSRQKEMSLMETRPSAPLRTACRFGFFSFRCGGSLFSLSLSLSLSLILGSSQYKWNTPFRPVVLYVRSRIFLYALLTDELFTKSTLVILDFFFCIGPLLSGTIHITVVRAKSQNYYLQFISWCVWTASYYQVIASLKLQVQLINFFIKPKLRTFNKNRNW